MPPLEHFPEGPDRDMYLAIADSKKLTAKRRDALEEFIKTHAVAWGVGVVGAAEVDEINILQAAFKAMHVAIAAVVEKLPQQPQPLRVLVDGNRFKPYGDLPYECIVKGDANVLSIAAGSILAKTEHDRIIRDLVEEDPTTYAKYDLLNNMGYATKKHVAAIKEYGLTPEHRKSFHLKKLTQCAWETAE
jgi:ribonuclease HII